MPSKVHKLSKCAVNFSSSKWGREVNLMPLIGMFEMVMYYSSFVRNTCTAVALPRLARGWGWVFNFDVSDDYRSQIPNRASIGCSYIAAYLGT